MNIKGIIFLMIICVTATSCEWGKPGKKAPKITKDTLKYTYTTIDEKGTDCNDNPDSLCAEAKIRYPVFAGQPALNNILYKQLLRLSFTDSTVTDLKKIAANFVASYEKDRKTTPDLTAYDLQSNINVIRQDSSLVTLEFGYTCECGGAHGSAYLEYINWDTKKNRKILLSDILIDNYKASLNKIAEKIFRKEENLGDTASLANNYFFKDNRFSINDNYLISPTGIRFYYNDYEIKPYAAGPTDLLVPYSQIRSLLRPNTVVTQYHK
ncbi:MAG TPA: RsiV family protein [Mucilaginibacter sp.]|jgi:hypothetical protein